MNASCTIQEMAVEPARPELAAGPQTGASSTTQRPQESGRISSAELAQKVLKLTGSVRLVSRSAHHWHHCGINE
ncbi:MAG: hypothetical protein ACYC67_02595 [Prosthecobacter sp.]|jgi:hypothetical protein